MVDNTIIFALRDIRCKHNVGDLVHKDTEPEDYEHLLPCNGQSFDASAYPELAKKYPSSTLPNLNDDRFLEGSQSVGVCKNAGLPNITGTFKIAGFARGGIDDPSGAFNTINSPGNVATQGQSTEGLYYSGSGWGSFDASRSSSLYGASDTVQPKSYTVKVYVCYA